jgi:hypothetical protein
VIAKKTTKQLKKPVKIEATKALTMRAMFTPPR